jgi:DNA-directed RNA polymerase specialized sigma24 family protein
VERVRGSERTWERSHEFQGFFRRHHRELARLAFVMLGDPDGADDLAADAMAAAWRRWARVRAADQPLA